MATTNDIQQLHPIKADNSIDLDVNLFPKVIEDCIVEEDGETKLPIQRELIPGNFLNISDADPDSDPGKQIINFQIASLLPALKADILKAVYPVGSLYISATSTNNPNTIFGVNIGTWERLENTFLWALPEDSTRSVGNIKGDNILPILSHTHPLSVAPDKSAAYTTESVFEDAAKSIVTGSPSWTDVTSSHKDDDKAKAKDMVTSITAFETIPNVIPPDYKIGDIVISGPNYGWYSYLEGSSSYARNRFINKFDITHQHTIDPSSMIATNPLNSTSDNDLTNIIRNIAVCIWKRTA